MRNWLLFLIGLWSVLFLWRVLIPTYPAFLPYALIAIIGLGVASGFVWIMRQLLTVPEAFYEHLEAE